MNRIIRNPLCFISVLFLLLLVSIIFFFVKSESRSTIKYYFFPGNNYSIERLEERPLIYTKNKEERLEIYIKDILLGPVELESAPLFPPHTRLKSLLLREDKLYIDLEINIRELDMQIPITPSQITDLLKKNVQHNFHYVNDIVLTFNGEIPGEPPVNYP